MLPAREVGHVVEIEGYQFPDELYYTDRHLWVRKHPDGKLTFGIDDLGQKLMGKVMFVRTPKEGAQLTVGKVFGTCESMKWVERLTSPLTGVVRAVNHQLKAKPSTINLDPYGSGWIIAVESSASTDQELSKLVSGSAIVEWAKKEIEDRIKKDKK